MRLYDTVLIHSGGLDSTVLLYNLLKIGITPKALTFDYGQRHKVEIAHARAICHEVRVDWEVADISDLRGLISNSALHTGKVPEGHYSTESMKVTVSPNRNMIFLSVAAAHAKAIGAPSLHYAAHAGDHDIYPDCRPEFVKAMVRAITLGNWNAPQLMAPFVYMSKADIVRLGLGLDVPFSETWSCYNGTPPACGKCGTCVERLEAFHLAGAEDPLRYADREWWKGQSRLPEFKGEVNCG